MHILRITLVFALSLASVAHAQDTTAQAREAFGRAEHAFAEHDYELALELFRRAQALRPHDAVRFNVAVCLERLGRFREAAGEYDLAAASEQLPADTRREATELAARMRERLGTLEIRGEPGAVARVGELRCQIPCELAIDPGDHTVEVNDVRRDVHVGRGETTTIEIDATPAPSAAVTLSASDGAPSGWRSFGVMTAIGGVLAAVGGGGIIGFGLRTEELGAEYVNAPSAALRDEGLTMRALTNASIALAACGALLIAIDLVLLLVDPPRDGSSAWNRGRVGF